MRKQQKTIPVGSRVVLHKDSVGRLLQRKEESFLFYYSCNHYLLATFLVLDLVVLSLHKQPGWA